MSIQQEREELRDLVDKLGDENVADVLDYLRWVLADEDMLTPEELEEARLGALEIERGESISLEEYTEKRRTRT